jgi:superoxide dismutase, Cu-Zn family
MIKQWGIGMLSIAFITAGALADTGGANIKGTGMNSLLKGTVTLTDTSGGIKVAAHLTGVPPGQHGFHIHEFGSCDDMGKAAGGHYNPANAMHGMVVKDGIMKAHAGDLGNMTVGTDGTVTLEAVIPDVTLSGSKASVAGRAFIVHEKVDDFSQPVGNAGSRIGCGTIIITDK